MTLSHVGITEDDLQGSRITSQDGAYKRIQVLIKETLAKPVLGKKGASLPTSPTTDREVKKLWSEMKQ